MPQGSGDTQTVPRGALLGMGNKGGSRRKEKKERDATHICMDADVATGGGRPSDLWVHMVSVALATGLVMSQASEVSVLTVCRFPSLRSVALCG